MSYCRVLQTKLREIPATWVPGLLIILLNRASKEVFATSEALQNFIDRSLEEE